MARLMGPCEKGLCFLFLLVLPGLVSLYVEASDPMGSVISATAGYPFTGPIPGALRDQQQQQGRSISQRIGAGESVFHPVTGELVGEDGEPLFAAGAAGDVLMSSSSSSSSFSTRAAPSVASCGSTRAMPAEQGLYEEFMRRHPSVESLKMAYDRRATASSGGLRVEAVGDLAAAARVAGELKSVTEALQRTQEEEYDAKWLTHGQNIFSYEAWAKDWDENDRRLINLERLLYLATIDLTVLSYRGRVDLEKAIFEKRIPLLEMQSRRERLASSLFEALRDPAFQRAHLLSMSDEAMAKWISDTLPHAGGTKAAASFAEHLAATVLSNPTSGGGDAAADPLLTKIFQVAAGSHARFSHVRAPGYRPSAQASGPDAACASAGGDCEDTADIRCADGFTVLTGKCGGPADRKCCVPNETRDASPSSSSSSIVSAPGSLCESRGGRCVDREQSDTCPGSPGSEFARGMCPGRAQVQCCGAQGSGGEEEEDDLLVSSSPVAPYAAAGVGIVSAVREHLAVEKHERNGVAHKLILAAITTPENAGHIAGIIAEAHRMQMRADGPGDDSTREAIKYIKREAPADVVMTVMEAWTVTAVISGLSQLWRDAKPRVYLETLRKGASAARTIANWVAGNHPLNTAKSVIEGVRSGGDLSSMGGGGAGVATSPGFAALYLAPVVAAFTLAISIHDLLTLNLVEHSKFEVVARSFLVLLAAAALVCTVAFPGSIIITVLSFAAMGLNMLIDWLVKRYFSKGKELARRLGFSLGGPREARAMVERYPCNALARLPTIAVASAMAQLLQGWTADDEEQSLIRLWCCLAAEGECAKADEAAHTVPGNLREISGNMHGREAKAWADAVNSCAGVSAATDDDETRDIVNSNSGQCAHLRSMSKYQIYRFVQNLFKGYTGEADSRALVRLVRCSTAETLRWLVAQPNTSVEDFRKEMDREEWEQVRNSFPATVECRTQNNGQQIVVVDTEGTCQVFGRRTCNTHTSCRPMARGGKPSCRHTCACDKRGENECVCLRAFNARTDICRSRPEKF